MGHVQAAFGSFSKAVVTLFGIVTTIQVRLPSYSKTVVSVPFLSID
jgi:hypothetical protein